jgi:hypothetical protein
MYEQHFETAPSLLNLSAIESEHARLVCGQFVLPKTLLCNRIKVEGPNSSIGMYNMQKLSSFLN